MGCDELVESLARFAPTRLGNKSLILTEPRPAEKPKIDFFSVDGKRGACQVKQTLGRRQPLRQAVEAGRRSRQPRGDEFERQVATLLRPQAAIADVPTD